jgi:hypothetical protein
LKNNGIDVKDITYFLIKMGDYKAYELDFFETQYINTKKGKKASKAIKDAKDMGDYNLLMELKNGLSFNSKNERDEKYDILHIVKERVNFNTNKDPIYLPEFKDCIKGIIDAQNAKFDIKKINQDNSVWKNNSY